MRDDHISDHGYFLCKYGERLSIDDRGGREIHCMHLFYTRANMQAKTAGSTIREISRFANNIAIISSPKCALLLMRVREQLRNLLTCKYVKMAKESLPEQSCIVRMINGSSTIS